MLVAWTTVTERTDADRLAAAAIGAGFAACVQIDGPITSHYRWQGRAEQAQEYRLCFKFLAPTADALKEQVLGAHPYDTPEWIVVRAEDVGEKYLSWAKANSSSLPL